MRALVPSRALSLAAGHRRRDDTLRKGAVGIADPNEASLLRAMNEVRGATGLRPLRFDPRLEVAARNHSAKMLRVQTMFHGNFVLRIRRVGVKAPTIGENLAWGTGSLARARKIVALWLASPEHRANLLRRGYRTVGVGVRRGRFEGYAGATLITADFAGR